MQKKDLKNLFQKGQVLEKLTNNNAEKIQIKEVQECCKSLHVGWFQHNNL
jgi:hypothetical protein